MQSHPVWVRGLKLILAFSAVFGCVSHPVWVRGLKHSVTVYYSKTFEVAPCMGAWIET